jgi:hypothetical protein
MWDTLSFDHQSREKNACGTPTLSTTDDDAPTKVGVPDSKLCDLR